MKFVVKVILNDQIILSFNHVSKYAAKQHAKRLEKTYDYVIIEPWQPNEEVKVA